MKRHYHQILGSEQEGPTSRDLSVAGSRSQTPSRPQGQGNGATAYMSTGLMRKATFEPGASILLIGIRGVGKSTLGVLAATAYNRRLIDSDRAFLEATGSSTTAYRKLNGTKEYQKRHKQVLESTLNNHRTDSVIVCSFSDLEGEGASLIHKYSRSHPVIHVTRDTTGIRSHLQVWTVEKVNELLSASSTLLRSCSNYEFFNLSETQDAADNSCSVDPQKAEQEKHKVSNGSFLTLKRVEREFLRLLRNIIGDEHRPSHLSAYHLSKIQFEDRRHTFAVTIAVSDVIGNRIDLEGMQIGADSVDLFVESDYEDVSSRLSDVSHAFAIVRRATILPICLSIGVDRRSTQVSSAILSEMTECCLRLGPELCKINLSLEDTEIHQLVARKGYSRIIGASNTSNRPARGWNDTVCIEVYRRAARLGLDLIEITMPAESVEDAFAIHSFQTNVEALNLAPRLIAYNTGWKGKLSKCFNKILTPVKPSAFPDDASSDLRDLDDGVSAKAVTQALFANFILQPLQFFLCGADVSYSLSPAMHNAAYKACGLRYTYNTQSCETLDFAEILRRPSLGGLALAQPFKMMAVSQLDGLSPQAKAIGAVNTVVPVYQLMPDGNLPEELAVVAQRNMLGPVKAWYGYNTDWIGIRACIRRGLSPANTVRSNSSALVCGAGGMARSALYSLISLGVRNIFLCNRTHEKAVALAEHYNNLIDAGDIPEMGRDDATRIRVLDSFTSSWPQDMRQPTMIVWCIPRQAAESSSNTSSLPEMWLKSPTGGVVVEVAYRPIVSPIALQIKRHSHAGWIFMDGYDMLPEQAYAQFEILTGRRAPRKVMRDEIITHLSEV